jgi:RNA polymerase sigma-70 factor (ECF subfamily)
MEILLQTLKPDYADVLRRVDLLEQSRGEVAATLGITVNNLTIRLYRARQALRRALALTCETCPIHGYLDCGCAYTKQVRGRPPRRN